MEETAPGLKVNFGVLDKKILSVSSLQVMVASPALVDLILPVVAPLLSVTAVGWVRVSCDLVEDKVTVLPEILLVTPPVTWTKVVLRDTSVLLDVSLDLERVQVELIGSTEPTVVVAAMVVEVKLVEVAVIVEDSAA